MKNVDNKIKQVGNFVVSYRSPKEVAISWKGVLGCISTQLMTNEKVRGFLTPTGTYCDLPFEGVAYPAINFHIPFFMTRGKLERKLIKASR